MKDAVTAKYAYRMEAFGGKRITKVCPCLTIAGTFVFWTIVHEYVW
jgi:hypothetical protein